MGSPALLGREGQVQGEPARAAVGWPHRLWDPIVNRAVQVAERTLQRADCDACGFRRAQPKLRVQVSASRPPSALGYPETQLPGLTLRNRKTCLSGGGKKLTVSPPSHLMPPGPAHICWAGFNVLRVNHFIRVPVTGWFCKGV